MQNRDVWNRIAAYHFPKGFDEKLMEDFDCSSDIAKKLCEEYRRFVYLAMIFEDQVTPSVQVDRVWHLHLTYTRDYWNRFCGVELEREFHHDPCDGPEDAPRYQQQYIETLALYKEEFGKTPPFKAWPSEYSERIRKVVDFVGLGVFFLFFLWIAISIFVLESSNIAPFFLAALGLLIYALLSEQVSPFGHKSTSSGNSGGGGGCGGCGGG